MAPNSKMAMFVLLVVVVLITFCFIGGHVLVKYNDSYSSTPLHFVRETTTGTSTEDTNKLSASVIERLLSLSKHLDAAESHARGMKTLNSIRKAKSELSTVLKSLGLDNNNITKSGLIRDKPANVCPEKYMDTRYGHRRNYETGFVVTNCSYAKPLSQLVSVVLVDRISMSETSTMITNLRKLEPDMPIVLGIVNTKEKAVREFISKFRNVAIIVYNTTWSAGKLWNSLAASVKTEYMFVGRDVSDWDEYARIDRLVREIEMVNVTIVSGSIRNQDAHWNYDCYQRALRNYTLVYYSGFDVSIHECLYCDHIEGPFLIRPRDFIRVQMDEHIREDGVFEDFFIRLGDESIISCPDSMLHVNKSDQSVNVSDWKDFGKKHELWSMSYHPGITIQFPCVQPYNCHKGATTVVHPCCLRELADMNLRAIDICEKANALCSLDSGTLMGAVKLNRVLPWDIDGDIEYVPRDYDKFIRSGREHSKPFIWSRAERPRNNSKGQLVGGFCKLHNSHWFIEIWLATFGLPTERYVQNGKGSTKILFHGRWSPVTNSPGLVVRNRYGYNTYQHQVHWRHHGFRTSWIMYNTTRFSGCKVNRHNCLNHYRSDGNLQFSEPIP